MHFIFARLVENLFELNLELTLSKADYQNHLNELYVYGYYRTVAPDVTVFHHLLILKFFIVQWSIFVYLMFGMRLKISFYVI